MGLAARVVLPGAFIFDLPMRPPPNICENLHKWELGSGVWSVPSTQSSYAWRITLLRVYTAKRYTYNVLTKRFQVSEFS